MFDLSPRRTKLLQLRLARVGSVALAIVIVVLSGFITFDCMYFYRAELHSETPVPVGVSLLIFAILMLLIMVAGYAAYRLARFGFKRV